MHLTHLPRALLLLLTLTLTLTPNTLALPSHSQQTLLDPHSPQARQQRLEAWKAQKPMHTTALLAGAAATAVSESQLRNGRRRDLSGITGEKGMWMPVEFLDGGDGAGGDEKEGDRDGEKIGETEVEVQGEVEFEDEDEDEDVGMEMSMYGIKDVFERVWKKMEKIGLIAQRKKQQRGKAKELDDGHDGDL